MSLQDAIEYGKYGWAVFPLLPRSKAPACPGGFHDAVKDEAAIRALWGNRTNLNLGIATGDISGFWVLDIDADKGGQQSLEELENKYGSLPHTLTSRTGGGGTHFLFKMPKGYSIGCTIAKIARGIDTRGNGGYIAAPPSIHPTGTNYAWDSDGENISDAPLWLIRLITEIKKEMIPTGTTGQVIGDWTTEDVLSMLEVISPDERDTWINVGMALHEGGWPVTMWDTWSRASQKYKMGEPFRIWKGFKPGGGISMGTLVHMAQEAGWEPKEKPYEELDFSNINGVDLTAFKSKINAIELPRVETKISVGGLVGDTLSWINSTAFKLQPELTIMNILAALGAVFGRRYSLQKLNTRTNIYMVGIAETGQGKDNSRQKVKQLLKLSGLEQFSGPDEIRSGPGLMVELKKRPSFLANIDEIGMFMRALFDNKAPAYTREISSMFTKMYSCSATTYEGGIIASQPDERTVLHEPNLCIYGTTTLSSYAEAMRSSSIKSGELNRFIVLKSSVDFPEPNFNSDNCDPPETLISRWSKFAVSGLDAAPDIIEQKKTIVMLGAMEEKVNDLFRFQDQMIREYRAAGMGALWVRYRENILKVAMIIAIARDPVNPVLIDSDLEFGKSLVGSSIRFMMKFATENMYDGEFQKMCSEFMGALEGGADTRTDMIKRLKIKTKQLDEIETALKEMGKIDFDIKERPRRYITK
jgi:hypothetical protein